MSNELATIDKVETLSLAEFFTAGGIKEIVDTIINEAESVIVDTSTPKGRKDAISLAYEVTRSKTYIDKEGLNLTKKWRDQVNKVNAERKYATEKLNECAARIRKPVTDWEEQEQRRKDIIRSRIDSINEFGNCVYSKSSDLDAAIHELEGVEITEDLYSEYVALAESSKDQVLTSMKAKLASMKEEEAERERLAEIERVKREQEQKARAEEEARLKEERAKIEAERAELQKLQQQKEEEERKLRAERERLERERAEIERQKIEAIERSEREKRERKEAEELAKRKADEELEEKRRIAERKKAIIDEIVKQIVASQSAEQFANDVWDGKVKYLKVVS